MRTGAQRIHEEIWIPYMSVCGHGVLKPTYTVVMVMLITLEHTL